MTRARVVLLAAALGVTSVAFVDVCDLLFDCGCRSLWNGAAAHCNIHHELPPHCPWCAHPFSAGAAAFLAAVAAQAGIVFAPLGGLGLSARVARSRCLPPRERRRRMGGGAPPRVLELA